MKVSELHIGDKITWFMARASEPEDDEGIIKFIGKKGGYGDDDSIWCDWSSGWGYVSADSVILLEKVKMFKGRCQCSDCMAMRKYESKRR